MTMLVQRLQAAGDLAGRLCLAAIFLHEGYIKLAGYGRASLYMERYGVSPRLLPLVIAVELLGGMMVALGLFTRAASLALAGFCLLAALLFHSQFAEAGQLIQFEKNVAIAGGFLLLAVYGAGAWSCDGVWFRRSARE